MVEMLNTLHEQPTQPTPRLQSHHETYRLFNGCVPNVFLKNVYWNVAILGIFIVLVVELTSCGPGGLTRSQSAEPLPEFNEQNQYEPYFVTGEMNTPRYFHEAIKLSTGLILIVGGTDESGFSALDTVEIFDQSTIQEDETVPESLKGTWFDTNFEGDPLIMQNPRLLHTLTRLSNDRIIILGGSPSMSQAIPIRQAEIFDPLTRVFEEVEGEMVEGRVRHVATPLDDGRLLISGGQFHTVFTLNQDVIVGGGFGQQGQGNIQTQTDIFPSNRESETFSLVNAEFQILNVPDTTRPATLTSSRGRSGHTVVRIAGPDNRLNSGDDLYLLFGGFQTFSGQNAPQILFPYSLGNSVTPLLQVEFFDPTVGIFTEVPIIRMRGPRVNIPQAANLGVHNQSTPDGVLGMGNAVLVCLGDDNAMDTFTTSIDEVFIATFTGFGPAQGFQLFRQEGSFNEHVQGIEAFEALGGEFEQAIPPGRTQTNIVTLPRSIPTLQGSDAGSWVFAGGGILVYPDLNGIVLYTGGTIAAGCLFDPFYSITAVLDFDSSARDLRPGRRNSGNPVGINGTWLALDGFIPTTTLDNFGDTPFGNFAVMKGEVRLNGKLISIAGQDGIDDTFDDRVLFTGGGTNFITGGGEPTFPSSEILLVPGTGSDQ